MVNAGVYLIVRLAPVLQGSLAGTVVALVGAVTFLVASLAAVGTSDAKKLLAYSTVANLGLDRDLRRHWHVRGRCGPGCC